MEQKFSKIDPLLNTDKAKGLSSFEVNRRKKAFGENCYYQKKRKIVVEFAKAFINPISLILIAAGILSIFMNGISDAIIILSIVVINGVLSFSQEYKSRHAVELLNKMIRHKVLCMRDGKKIAIDTESLVPGDIIFLGANDIVPADSRIIETNHLYTNESTFSGESNSILKQNQDVLYCGTTIEQGSCIAIVTAIGSRTQLGKVVGVSRDTEGTSPFQRSLITFSSYLIQIVGATIVFMLIVKGRSIGSVSGFLELIIFSIALAMTVIPEALPIITTVTLSSGAFRLAKKNVITKRLPAIEELGRVNLLCTDKTGTLTYDKMKVNRIYSEDDILFQSLIYAAIEDIETLNLKEVNSFDKALGAYIPKRIRKLAAKYEQLGALPFDAEAKRRRVLLKDTDTNKYYLVVIGAAENLFELSVGVNNTKYQKIIEGTAKQGMRQLALGYKIVTIDANKEMFRIEDILANDNDLTFLGLVTLNDEIRSTAKQTVNEAKQLGIQVKILTGDSPEVAAYVGHELGLLEEGKYVYTGDELERLTAMEYENVVKTNHVFARISPTQKYNIIKQLKNDNILAYQGDGINDVPSLQLADVSIAVHNATDVAKDSADIVLLEDDLSVLLNGIKYGRSIFVNIHKYIKHAMIGNLGNFFSMIAFYLIFNADIPMLAIQLLVGNLIQDFPLMAVFSDRVDKEVIEKPQKVDEIRDVIVSSLVLGGITAIYYLLFFLYIGKTATAVTQTMLFLFYNFTQLLIILSIRSNRPMFKASKPSKLLLGAILFFMALSLALAYIPVTANILGMTALPMSKLILICAITVIYLILLDVSKCIMVRYRIKKNNNCDFS